MERITVNMSPTAMLETCHASQFDVGVQKRFDLVDGSSAYTLIGAETITLKIRTPDGTLVESNVPNTSDSYVIWTSGEGELDAFGICLCSIHVTNGSDELGSGNFIMEVEADPYDGKNVRTVTVGPADICTFETTLPEPYQSVIVNVVATGGNGTPDNPIPINGYTEAKITANGNTYTIAFGQTVYGGVLDVTRGKLSVTHINVDLGSLSWVYIPIQQRFYAIIPDADFPSTSTNVADILSSIYKVISFQQLSEGSDNNTVAGVYTTDHYITVRDTRYSDAPTFKTAMSGNYVVVKLATPFDIDLTPVQIRALVGQNNVFADTGDTEVKYLTEGV